LNDLIDEVQFARVRDPEDLPSEIAVKRPDFGYGAAVRPLGAWVPWELQGYVQLEEIADEAFEAAEVTTSSRTKDEHDGRGG
jgi:hypothetical protein